jgi:hypothetical protein
MVESIYFAEVSDNDFQGCRGEKPWKEGGTVCHHHSLVIELSQARPGAG